MQLVSNIGKSSLSKEDLFKFLSKIDNYEGLMPENTKSFKVNKEGTGFFVQIGNLPEVGMILEDSKPNEQIIFKSPSSNFDYQLKINMLEENNAGVELLFDGKFNAMIEMMAKKPLQNFINTIADNVSKL